MTDTAAEAPKVKKPATPEQAAARQATRSVARALARLEGKPGDDDFKARWNEKKADYTTEARKLVRALTKEGITLAAGEGGRGKGKGKGQGKGKGKGKQAAEGSAGESTEA